MRSSAAARDARRVHAPVLARVDLGHLDGEVAEDRPGDAQRVGVEGPGEEDAGAVRGVDRHEHALGRRRRALVERGVGDVETGEARDLGLELEEGLERALARLALVGRVRGQELAAADELVDERRHEVVVRAGAGEARQLAGGPVRARELGELALKLEFARRGREIEVAPHPARLGDDLEELVDRRDAHGVEHLAALVGGDGGVVHRVVAPLGRRRVGETRTRPAPRATRRDARRGQVYACLGGRSKGRGPRIARSPGGRSMSVDRRPPDVRRRHAHRPQTNRRDARARAAGDRRAPARARRERPRSRAPAGAPRRVRSHAARRADRGRPRRVAPAGARRRADRSLLRGARRGDRGPPARRRVHRVPPPPARPGARPSPRRTASPEPPTAKRSR